MGQILFFLKNLAVQVCCFLSFFDELLIFLPQVQMKLLIFIAAVLYLMLDLFYFREWILELFLAIFFKTKIIFF